jgi:hypothetical protein
MAGTIMQIALQYLPGVLNKMGKSAVEFSETLRCCSIFPAIKGRLERRPRDRSWRTRPNGPERNTKPYPSFCYDCPCINGVADPGDA